MNIFILDEDMKTNVSYYVDSHVRKMVLETAQLIQTSLWVDSLFNYPIPRKLDKEERSILMKAKEEIPNLWTYKPTHENHPCSIWMRESRSNFEFTRELFWTLVEEYRYRFGVTHMSVKIGNDYEVYNPPDIGLTKFAKAMPDELKLDTPVASYRNYYIENKKHLFVWTKREPPSWIPKKVLDFLSQIKYNSI